MSFVNVLKIKVRPGDGGYGSSSSYGKGKILFDGGNGGRGGNIVLKYNKKYTTLDHIKQYSFKAEKGNNGSRNNQNGKNGNDTVIYLTNYCTVKFITNNDFFLQQYDINILNNELVIYGANGGRGSMFTKSLKTEACLPEYSDSYLLELKSIFDANSYAIIFYSHINNYEANFLRMLPFTVHINKKYCFYYTEYGSIKFYIFNQFYKQILSSISNFKLVICVYNDINNLPFIKNSFNNVIGSSNIIFLTLKQLLDCSFI